MNPPLRSLSSPILVLATSHIDTDQIIPARFLTTTIKTGLGQYAFADYRCDPAAAQASTCPLDDPRANACQILVAGDNFGCGSSREHAPWALLDMGIRVVISTSVADIFRSNAHKNGLLALVIDAEAHGLLIDSPWQTVNIDLETQEVGLPDGRRVGFEVDAFARHCLLNGLDELDYLLTHRDAIACYERSTFAE